MAHKNRRASKVPGFFVEGEGEPRAITRERGLFLRAIRTHAPHVEKTFSALRPLALACREAQLAAEPKAKDPEIADNLRRIPWPVLTIDMYPPDIAGGKLPPEDSPEHPANRLGLTDAQWQNVTAYRDALTAWARSHNLLTFWILDIGAYALTNGRPEVVAHPLALSTVHGGGRRVRRGGRTAFPVHLPEYYFDESESDYIHRVTSIAAQWARERYQARTAGLTESMPSANVNRDRNIAIAARWQVDDADWAAFRDRLGVARDDHYMGVELRKILRQMALQPRSGLQ